MSDERLGDLLEQWEELHERGENTALEELCPDCPDLLEPLRRQVAALLAFEQFSPGSSDHSTDATFIDPFATEPTTVGQPPATVIPDGYRIKRELGRGGMG